MDKTVIYLLTFYLTRSFRLSVGGKPPAISQALSALVSGQCWSMALQSISFIGFLAIRSKSFSQSVYLTTITMVSLQERIHSYVPGFHCIGGAAMLLGAIGVVILYNLWFLFCLMTFTGYSENHILVALLGIASCSAVTTATSVLAGGARDLDQQLQQLSVAKWEDDNSYGDKNICPICLENIQPGDIYVTGVLCYHSFHFPCIQQWLLSSASRQQTQRKINCPLCRQEFVGQTTSSRRIFKDCTLWGGLIETLMGNKDFVIKFEVWLLKQFDL